eukprot:SAG11_NODE_3587_length_2351_cov_1.450266_1_plen_217_part_00
MDLFEESPGKLPDDADVDKIVALTQQWFSFAVDPRSCAAPLRRRTFEAAIGRAAVDEMLPPATSLDEEVAGASARLRAELFARTRPTRSRRARAQATARAKFARDEAVLNQQVLKLKKEYTWRAVAANRLWAHVRANSVPALIVTFTEDGDGNLHRAEGESPMTAADLSVAQLFRVNQRARALSMYYRMLNEMADAGRLPTFHDSDAAARAASLTF